MPGLGPKPPASIFSLRLIIAFRLLNAWCLATFFQPDEFFQVLEPAWQLVFGPESGAWLTWEWQYQLRSSLHPLLFSGAYLMADRLSAILPYGLRSAALIAAPRILQAIIAGLGDWYTWSLAKRIYDPHDDHVSFIALLLQLASPWQWYCSTRTFSNSLETTLTIMALYYWPWQLLLGSAAPPPTKENPKPVITTIISPSLPSLRCSLCLAALAVVLRPTNVLVWATIVFMTFTRAGLSGRPSSSSSSSSPLAFSTVFTLVREALICGSLVVGISVLADRAYFGFWTFPPYNWLNFNISKSLAVFYGRNPWHYYILQGIPLLCTTSLPFAIPSLLKPSAKSIDQANALKTLSYTIFVTVAVLSLISHKEVRFIYPLLPVLNILAAPRAASFFTSPPPPPPLPPASSSSSSSPQEEPSSSTPRPLTIRHKPLLSAALAINLLLAGYLSLLHQAAPLTVLSFLRSEYERIHPSAAAAAAAIHLDHNSHQQQEQEQDDLFALFLMPCHSTPWRSHLIYPSLSARALTCEPPLHTLPNTPERLNYRDEADRFYDDPLLFLRSEMFPPPQHDDDGGVVVVSPARPRYIIGFEGIEPWLREFMQSPEGQSLGFDLQRVWTGFNGFANEDWRRAGHLIVWDTSAQTEVAKE